MCLQHASAQSSISLAAIGSFCSERDRCMGLLCSLICLLDRPNSYFSNLLANARDSLSTFCCGASPPLDEFRVFVDEDDDFKNALVPFSADQFFVIFNKLCVCLSFCRTSSFFVLLNRALPCNIYPLADFSSIEQGVPPFSLKMPHLQDSLSSGYCITSCVLSVQTGSHCPPILVHNSAILSNLHSDFEIRYFNEIFGFPLGIRFCFGIIWFLSCAWF